MKNKMAQVAALFGVELGERFKITGQGDTIYFMDDRGVWEKSGELAGMVDITFILRGDAEIIKLPWKPRKGEEYYYIDRYGDPLKVLWENDHVDFCNALAANVFCTQEEAMEHASEIMEKFKEWRS